MIVQGLLLGLWLVRFGTLIELYLKIRRITPPGTHFAVSPGWVAHQTTRNVLWRIVTLVCLTGSFALTRVWFLTLCKARRILAKRPSWLKSVKGDLQMHTNWSDGEGTIEEMSSAAAERNYEYIATTDYTKGLKISGGINEAQVKQQGRDIAAINAKGGVAVLPSVEMNLNPHGKGDMDSACLRKLDLVLGCFHSSLRKADDQTERYVNALRNPDIQILGHPRGRIYNFRYGLNADWERVFDVAGELDKSVEIGGYPDQQDLGVDLVKVAKKCGCKISFGTDSHGPSQLRLMEFSAAAALTAGIKPESILNFMPKDRLLGWVDNVERKSRNA